MKDTLEFYNKIYEKIALKKYKPRKSSSLAAFKVFKKFSDRNNINIESVIDVGCRWGETFKNWQEANIKICGIDVSQFMVEYCKRQEYECYLASATDLSIFKDKQFDLYAATDVYEHLREEDLDDAIEEAKRITKKYLLIRPHPNLDKRGRKNKKKALHLTVWELRKWEIFFEKHNLTIINIKNKNGKKTYKRVFLMEVNKYK